MSRLNLAFDAKRFFNNQTGLGNYARTLLSNLTAFAPEHNYHLYTPKLNKELAPHNLNKNGNINISESDSIFRSYWRSFSIKDQLKQDGIDIYHGLSNEIPFGSFQNKIKTAVTIHDVIFKVLPQTFPFIDRKMYDLKTKSSCNNANLIIAISENTKKDLINYYNTDPKKIKVIPQTCKSIFKTAIDQNKINEIRSKYNLPSEFIISVGTIEKRKNIALVIKALNQLGKNLQIPLVIVGKATPYKKTIVKLVAEKQLQARVFWIHDLKDDLELKALYHAASILVYPSIYEGFGLPVLEALNCNLPVITSNVSSLPEAGGPSSIYINPQDPEELAYQIGVVLEDEKHKTKMQSEGKRYADQFFDAKMLSDELIKAYLSL